MTTRSLIAYAVDAHVWLRVRQEDTVSELSRSSNKDARHYPSTGRLPPRPPYARSGRRFGRQTRGERRIRIRCRVSFKRCSNFRPRCQRVRSPPARIACNRPSALCRSIITRDATSDLSKVRFVQFFSIIIRPCLRFAAPLPPPRVIN